MAREMTLFDFDLKRCLPPFMLEDPFVVALAEVTSYYARKSLDGFERLPFWAYIDQLSEWECDEAAYEMDLDFYDSTADLQTKRGLIKNGLKIKALRGTKWSTEKLLTMYFGEQSWIDEWYQEDGTTPYTFTAYTQNPIPDKAAADKFQAAIKYSKNARSVMDGLFYFWDLGQSELGFQNCLKSGRWRHMESGTYPYLYWKGKNQDLGFELESKAGRIGHLPCSKKTYSINGKLAKR